MSNHWIAGKRALRIAATLVGAGLLLAGCGPAAPAADKGVAPAAETRTSPKHIVIGIQSEFAYIIQYGRVSSANPGPERYWTFHSNLTYFNETGDPVARIAEKVPSLQDGDWKANADGTMEVTWKLRPDVLWHDGTSLTAEDFVFGLEVAVDPRLAAAELDHLRKISAVRAPDPRTLVVSWKEPYIYANSNNQSGIPPMPRHQIEPLYRGGDVQAIEASPVWRDQFMGLGPFRVTNWEPGSHVDAEAFDRYFLGRPKLDRVTFKFISDVNVAVANFLAGTLDVGMVGTMLKPEQLRELRNQWGPNKGMVFAERALGRTMALNFRTEGQPWQPSQAGWANDKRFRQAMLYSMDREELVEALHRGYASVAYFFSFPEDPVYALGERQGFPKYERNPTKAQQLFAEAGWTKGPDGLLRNSAGLTAPFYCCRYSDADSNDIRESLAWGQDLKDAGVEVIHPIPQVPAGSSATERRRLQTFGWGGKITNWYFNMRENYNTISSDRIPTQQNAWSGANTGAYDSPRYQQLLDQRLKTLPQDPRKQVELQLLGFIADELPMLPVYYNPLGLVAREGVIGFAKSECTKTCNHSSIVNDAVTWNIHLWDLK